MYKSEATRLRHRQARASYHTITLTHFVCCDVCCTTCSHARTCMCSFAGLPFRKRRRKCLMRVRFVIGSQIAMNLFITIDSKIHTTHRIRKPTMKSPRVRLAQYSKSTPEYYSLLQQISQPIQPVRLLGTIFYTAARSIPEACYRLLPTPDSSFYLVDIHV